MDSFKRDSISFHSATRRDITEIFERYKQSHSKLSPLPLNQFYQMALSENVDLLQVQPLGETSNFLSFKEINQSAVSELKRSLQESKTVWNNYSKYLFGDNSLDEEEEPQQSQTSSRLQLIHNRETFHKIRNQFKRQEEAQLNEVHKALKKIHTQTNGYKIYPSLAYQDQQKLELLRKQVRLGGVQRLQERSDDAQQLQKRINESQVALTQIKKQFVYAYNFDYNFWGPCSRDGSTMVTYDRKLFMYGGSSAVQQEDLCVAIVDKQFYKWNPQKLDEKPIHGYRVHHTAGIYKNNMILFGGEIHIEQSNHKIVSECTSDVKIISLTSFDIKLIKQPGTISPRKCHVSEIVGRTLLVFGGVDNRNNYLKDLLGYDISQQKWFPLNIDPFDFYENGIAFHKSCLVTQNKFCDIYRQDPDLKFSNQGVYVFGGQDKFGNYLDTFIRIDVYQKPIRFEKVEYTGTLPMSRCQHSMNYNESLGSIIVYGGKNDDNTHEGFLNNLHMFDVKNSQWVQLDIKGAQLPGRCGHSSACIDTKIFIFGGYNYNGFVKSEVLVIELDTNVSNQLLAQERGEDVKPRNSMVANSFHIDIEKKKPIDRSSERKKAIESLNFKNSHSFLPMPRRVTMLINAMKFGQDKPTETNTNRNSPVGRRFHKNLTVIVEGKQ